MNKTGIILIIVIILISVFYMYNQNQPGQLDEFAQCISDSGAKFYGAFWCSHCQTQKSMFGNSQKLLPYIECSTLDGNGQTAICQQNNIESYPTWEWADGNRQTGKVSLQELAQKTNCQLL